MPHHLLGIYLASRSPILGIYLPPVLGQVQRRQPATGRGSDNFDSAGINLEVQSNFRYNPGGVDKVRYMPASTL